MRRLCPNRLDVCQKYWAYTTYFVDGYTIPFREKEILILRTAWLSRGDYIWGRHYVRGKEAGLTEEEIGKITEGPAASGWNDFDATLLRAADELHTSRFLSDATWNALAERYTDDRPCVSGTVRQAHSNFFHALPTVESQVIVFRGAVAA